MIAITRFVTLLIAVLGSFTFAQIPCDDAYGEFCPSESGWAVGDCLRKVGIEKLSKECASFIKLQEVCKADIDAFCGGKEYSGDLLVCLTEWTKPETLSKECQASLPKKEEKKQKKLTKEERLKADRRKKIRNKAAKMARGDL